MPDKQSNRERPQARELSKCLNGRGNGKDWTNRLSDLQLQEARKIDSQRAITPAAEAVRVSAHLVPSGSLQTKQLCHLHAQLSLGQNCHKRKKKSTIYAYRVAKSRTLLKRPCKHRCETIFVCGSSAPVRIEHEGGTVTWLAGSLVILSVQGHSLPPLQELWPFQSLFLSLL